MSERVAVTIKAGVAEVRLNRPQKLNALDLDMFTAIAEAIDRLADARDVRAVVLCGEGRAFCAGLDTAAMAAGGLGLPLGARTRGLANLVQYAAWGWRTLPMPVIAAVHGVAFGGGLQIMAGADLRIAHPASRFSIRETHWGLVPDMGGVALWKGLVRDDVLRELTFTAREFEAGEAQQYGFVTRVSDDPFSDAGDLARTIAGRSPDAVRAAKRLYNMASEADAARILREESAEQEALKGRRNQREAVAAHAEARAPQFED